MRAAPLRCLLASALCAALLAGCGDTLQDKPIPHNLLEGMIVTPFPVYWAGESFQGLHITEATHDYSGAFAIQYGNCLQGGQGTCTPPLRIVTSPDNSFLPGGQTPSARAVIRGVPALLTEAGRVISIPTGGVVVDVFAESGALARAAAAAVVAINAPGSPGQTLPPRAPNTGFGATPLPQQLAPTVRPLG
jgi:hypothetical protein